MSALDICPIVLAVARGQNGTNGTKSTRVVNNILKLTGRGGRCCYLSLANVSYARYALQQWRLYEKLEVSTCLSW